MNQGNRTRVAVIRFAINGGGWIYIRNRKKEKKERRTRLKHRLYRIYYLSSVCRDRVWRMKIVQVSGRGARRPLNFTGLLLSGRTPRGGRTSFHGSSITTLTGSNRRWRGTGKKNPFSIRRYHRVLSTENYRYQAGNIRQLRA